MRPLTLLLGVSAFALLPSTLSAQAKPSFAAKWTMIVDTTSSTSTSTPAPTRGRRGGRGGGGGARGGMGTEMTITQDAKTLTITRTTRAGETRHVYNLDGSESRNTMTGGRGGSVEQVSKAKWDASKLVITTSSTFNGNPMESTMSLSVDPSGNLVVETTGGSRGGGTQVTTKTSYKKA